MSIPMDQELTKYVQIQCRSKEFRISKSSLEMFPNSMLTRRFLGSGFNNDNYVDRDPELFKLVMDYYTDQKLIIPFNIPYDRVKLEFEFFCLEPNNLWIQNMNDNWRRNDKIKEIEAELDKLIFSESLQFKILNTVGFCINVQKTDTELYNIFNGDSTHKIAKVYLKSKYNLECTWKYKNQKAITMEFTMDYFYGNRVVRPSF